MTDAIHTAGRAYMTLINYHGAIVQGRAILSEDTFVRQAL